MTSRSRYGLVFLTLMLLLSVRCGALDDPVKEAVGAIDRAMWMVQNESKDWREILRETEDELASDAQSMMVNEVNSAFSRAIGATGAEFRCDTIFVEDRLLQDLERIRAELLNESVPDKEPGICLVDPMSVDVSLIPERLKWVQVYGYDFDTPDVQLLLQNGDQYVDVTSSCLRKPTYFHMTIDLISEGCQLTQASRGFVLKWNNQEMSSIKISQLPTPPTVTPAPDQWVGPWGGGGGSEFADVVPLGAKVIGLQIRSGQRVDSIQVFLSTGATSKHGGSGGDLHDIRFEEDEYITAVYGRYGARVDQIAIRTNKGTYGPYGGTGGANPFSFEVTAGFQIVGFFGRSGDEVDAIGLIVRQRQ